MFSEKLKKLREERKISQYELAEKIYVSRTAVSKWERGVGIPSDVNLKSLCNYFNVDEEYLLDRQDLKKELKKANSKINKYIPLIMISSLLVIALLLVLIFIPKGNQDKMSNKRNLDPATMTLEDYKGIDYRNIGKTEYIEYGERDLTNIKLKNDREPLENEIKVKLYIYNDDVIKEAKYIYLEKGEDYRGKVIGANNFETSIESDNYWTGYGNSEIEIGYYSDKDFKNLIDSELFASVDERLQEIHVRRVMSRNVYRVITNGTYVLDNNKVVVDGNVWNVTYNGDQYKFVGEYDVGGQFKATEFYKNNNQLFEENMKFIGNGLFGIVSYVYFEFNTKSGVVIPYHFNVNDVYLSTNPYTCLANY